MKANMLHLDGAASVMLQDKANNYLFTIDWGESYFLWNVQNRWTIKKNYIFILFKLIE